MCLHRITPTLEKGQWCVTAYCTLKNINKSEGILATCSVTQPQHNKYVLNLVNELLQITVSNLLLLFIKMATLFTRHLKIKEAQRNVCFFFRNILHHKR